MDIDLTLALFGAVYEGDPTGGSSTLIPETMYPTLGSFCEVMGLTPDLVYKILVDEGAVRMMTKEGWVVATHAYTHDNNTSRRLQ